MSTRITGEKHPQAFLRLPKGPGSEPGFADGTEAELRLNTDEISKSE